MGLRWRAADDVAERGLVGRASAKGAGVKLLPVVAVVAVAVAVEAEAAEAAEAAEEASSREGGFSDLTRLLFSVSSSFSNERFRDDAGEGVDFSRSSATPSS